MHMISLPEAIERLRNSSSILPASETVELRACLGRTLARDVTAGIDVPPADNSAMDGYALRWDTWKGPDQPLKISQRITAGTPPQALEAGTAARVFTGAEIPAGADVVVMQEHCRDDGHQVWIDTLRPVGANIRPQGQDIRRNAVVLNAGHRLRPQDIGLIASLGFADIKVRRRLRVAIISTGSELAEPGARLAPGQIYNSNRYMLDSMLRGWGFEVLDFGITMDDPQIISEVMVEASRQADVIMTSGGVSVGDEDHVKPVVEALGQLDLWRVAIKPGKPFAFGQVADTPFLGLPGNPVSALITALVIARPYLLDCQGASMAEPVPMRQIALFDHPGSDRQEYLQARSTAAGVEIFPKRSSGILFAACWGDGLVVQKPGQTIARGDSVNMIPYTFFN